MPFAPPRLCSRCRQIHGGRGCAAADAAYEQARGTAAQRGYDSAWARFSAAWRRRHPLCGDRVDGPSAEHSECVREERTTAAQVVDHIVPWRGDRAKKYDPRNLQSLCKQCHDSKTAREDGRWGYGG